MSWMLETTKREHRNMRHFVITVLLLNFGAIHATSMVRIYSPVQLFHSVYEHPRPSHMFCMNWQHALNMPNRCSMRSRRQSSKEAGPSLPSTNYGNLTASSKRHYDCPDFLLVSVHFRTLHTFLHVSRLSSYDAAESIERLHFFRWHEDPCRLHNSYSCLCH